MPLFEVAILEAPSRKAAEDGATERLAFPPTFVISKDPQSAAHRAVMENPDKVKDLDKARMQVLVRPFGPG